MDLGRRDEDRGPALLGGKGERRAAVRRRGRSQGQSSWCHRAQRTQVGNQRACSQLDPTLLQGTCPSPRILTLVSPPHSLPAILLQVLVGVISIVVFSLEHSRTGQGLCLSPLGRNLSRHKTGLHTSELLHGTPAECREPGARSLASGLGTVGVTVLLLRAMSTREWWKRRPHHILSDRK